MDRYRCPTCRKVVQCQGKGKLGFLVHDHYVKEIGGKFARNGCLTIQEGKIPAIPENWYEPWFDEIPVAYRSRNRQNYVRKWREPDLIVLSDDRLVKVIEVQGTAEDYGILAAKVAKINTYLRPRETIVFHAVKYVDRFLKPERRRRLEEIMGVQPRSYREVDQYYQKKFERERALKFTLWSEEDLMTARR